MQTERIPDVSIIVPTHNRSHSLRRTLDALAVQTFPPDLFEVVVVADGCVDETSAMLRAFSAPYTLRVLERPASGAAEARNAGAQSARAPLLVFIDDDIVPTPGCIAAHVQAHAATPGRVVFGPYPPVPQPGRSIFRQSMRDWWCKKFAEMAEPGHRFTYQSLLTGNLSLSAELWAQIGGLDPRFRKSGEDYELGIRLMAAGVPFHFAPDALGYHYEHETMSVAGAMRRAYNEGHTDVLMGRKHPAIQLTRHFVEWRRQSTRQQRAFVRLLYLLAGRGDPIAHALRHLLTVLGWAGLRKHWLKLYNNLRFYWYLRGVTEEFASAREWAGYAWDTTHEPAPIPELTIDLREGIAAAEACLDALRPGGAVLRYGKHNVAMMPIVPGAEPLRGAHLRPFLQHKAGLALLRALVLEQTIAEGSKIDADTIAGALDELAPYYGPESKAGMWEEQSSQWERLDRQLAGQNQHQPASARHHRSG